MEPLELQILGQHVTVKIVKNMNQGVIQVRKDICHDCPIPCDKQEKIDFISLKESSCPINRWGTWEGQKIGAKIKNDTLFSYLQYRIKSYRKTGWLVGIKEFLNRRTKCSSCEQKKIFDTHPGLYGCGSCSSCLGGPERMLQSQSVCPRNKW
jgi:hypothetical protein